MFTSVTLVLHNIHVMTFLVIVLVYKVHHRQPSTRHSLLRP